MRLFIRPVRWSLMMAVVLTMAAGCQTLPSRPVSAPEKRKPAPAPPAVPVGKLKIFRDSLQILHGKTVETFLRIEELEGKYAVMATDIDETLTLDAFEPVLSGRKLQTLTDLRFREAAADLLYRYGELLYAVSEGPLQSAVDRSAEELSGTLAIFGNAALPEGVGEPEVAGIFEEVAAVLDPIRQTEDRTGALKRLMDAAQVDIQRLASLIVRDHGRFKTLVDQMIRGIVASANARRPIHEDYIDPNLTAFDSRIAALIKESREIREALDAVMAGFSQAPEAHFAIRNILGRDLEGLPALQELLRKARQAERSFRVPEPETPPLP